MSSIDVEAYLAEARVLKPGEIEARKRLGDWLPEAFIDSHAHATLPEHVLEVPASSFRHMHSTFPSFTLEQSVQINALLHPDKHIRTLRFAIPWRGINHRVANQYLLDSSPADDRVALFGISDDVDYTVEALRQNRVSALKMYHAYLSPPATEIYDYFVPPVLEEASRLGIPVILHPPRIITSVLDQLQRLQRDFPKLTVVLAHLGLTKSVVPGLEEAYREVAKSERFYTDTSMVPSVDVVKLALKVFGINRVLYGSDQPVNLIRAVAYTHPRLGQRLVTEYPYHWVAADEHAEYGHLAANAPHTHWQQLEAIRQAIDALPPHEKAAAKDAVFNRNAISVFGF